jgi:Putative Actinobacterial Holin-X, holin superfamily III
MLAPSSALLRAGLGLKLNQIKRATRSYLRDRTDQATGTVASYAIAAGLFAVAGIFLIAACLVGVTALFRWVEINYGPFQAFGVVGALLLVLAAICAAFAAIKLRRPPRQFPSLASRLRVAVTASPISTGQIDEITDRAAAVSATSATRLGGRRHNTPLPRAGLDRNMQTGLAIAAILLGWAVARRRQQTRRWTKER